MEEFQDMYGISELNQDGESDLNKPKASSKIEAVILKLSQLNDAQIWMESSEKSTFREGLAPTGLKSFHKLEQEGSLPNYYFEGSITLISNPDKDPT